MLRAANADRAVAAECLLALEGITDPSPEQRTGARLKAQAYADLHVLALGKVWKEE